ncbi:MAG: hypothetical protein HOP03_14415 [Lysobacter sp.]|nr:hypothetical protein [Lysobacter sp.]
MPQDSCQPIRDFIEQLDTEIRELTDLLPELPLSQRPVTKLHIADLKRQRTRMKRALQACMQAKRTGA